MHGHRASAAAGLLLAITSASAPSLVQAQDEYYKGRTISIVLGTRSGSIATSAQLVGRHLGRHIPGNPTVINQQMPGGAHLVATNFVYNVAAADGQTLLAANPQVAMAQLANMPAVRFDARKFEWLGSSGSDGVLLGIRPALPYQTFKDLQAATQDLIVGSTGPGSNSHDFPLLLKEFAGIKVKFVAGYASNSDIALAIERGEVDAWTALSTTIKLAADRGAVRPLVRSRAPVVGYNHLPVDEDLATDPLGRSIMAIRGIPLTLGRAFAVRPGTPSDRVAILRDALARTLADPQFLADARTAQIDMAHITAADVMKGIDELMSQSPETVKAMLTYIKVAE